MFADWQKVTCNYIELRNICSKLNLRSLKSIKLDAITRWMLYTYKRKYMKDVGIRVMRRWMQAGVWRAFCAWSDRAASMRRMKEVGGKVLRRWLQAGVWRSFSRWQEVARTMRHMRCIGQRALGRWVQGAVSRCFQLWAAVAEVSDVCLLQAHHACLQISLASLRSCFFVRWQTATRNAKDIFFRGQRVLHRWIHSFVSISFKRWALLSKDVSNAPFDMHRMFDQPNDSALFIRRKNAASRELIVWIAKHVEHVSALKLCYSHSPLPKHVSRHRTPLSATLSRGSAAHAVSVSPCFPVPSNYSLSPSILNISSYGTSNSLYSAQQELTCQPYEASPTYAGALQFLSVLAERRLVAARNTQTLLQKLV
jgi:hypothetical protein